MVGVPAGARRRRVARRRRRRVVAGTGGASAAGPVTLDAGLAGTTSRFVTAVAALAAGPGDGRRRAAAARAGRWARCTTRWPRSAPPSTAGDGPGHLPVTVTGPLDARRRASTLPRRRVQPVPHGADADRPAARRRPAAAPHDAARVGALRRADGGGDGGVRRRRRRRRRRPRSSCPPAATGARDAHHRARRLVGQLPAGHGRRRRRPRRRSPGCGRARRRATRVFADLLGRMGCTVVDDAGRRSIVERDPAVPLRGIDVDMADIVRPRADARRGRRHGRVADDDHRRRVHPGQGERPPRRPRRRAGQDRRRVDRRSPTGCASSRRRLHGAVLATHHDHRLAMAFGVLGAGRRRHRGRRPGRRVEELAGLLDGPGPRSSTA